MKRLTAALAIVALALALTGCVTKGLDPRIHETELTGLRTNHEKLLEHEPDPIKVQLVRDTWAQVFANIAEAKRQLDGE